MIKNVILGKLHITFQWEKKHLVRSYLICSVRPVPRAGTDVGLWGFLEEEGSDREKLQLIHLFFHSVEIEVKLSILSSNKIGV